MLEVQKINAGYNGKLIVHDASFTVQTGNITVLLGQNGCGKSTLLKAISKIIHSSGTVAVDGVDIVKKSQKETAQYISVMAGAQQSYFSYTVFQTVLLARYAHSKKKLFSTDIFTREDRSIVTDILTELQLIQLQNRPLSSLSSGQLQKVFLSRALAQQTPVLLLDEPTSHLDLKAQIEIADLLTDLKQKRNLAILAVVHDINLALKIADTCLLMKDGRILKSVTKRDISFADLDYVYDTNVARYLHEGLRILD